MEAPSYTYKWSQQLSVEMVRIANEMELAFGFVNVTAQFMPLGYGVLLKGGSKDTAENRAMENGLLAPQTDAMMRFVVGEGARVMNRPEVEVGVGVVVRY